ncbi:outer membrane protein assembly factor BamB family protein [Natronomonas sp.]|uniref:outer membrane protein assembly factor BamB family protein n=1 Tax=Natronomonas sp. TaxID=2184060 RepID=UPI002FC3B5D3
MPSRRDYLRGVASAGFVGLAGCFDEEPVSGHWPRAGYDDRNTSDVTDIDGPGATLSRVWQANVPQGMNHASPVLADGRLYIGYETAPNGESPRRVGLRALDGSTGEIVHDITVTTHSADSAEMLFLDSVIVADDSVSLLAFDGIHSYARDGEERWHAPVDGAPNTTQIRAGYPVAADGIMYAPTASVTETTDATEGLLAIDAASGTIQWRYDVPDTPAFGWTFSAALADGLLYVSMLDEGVVALNPETGGVEWRTELPVEGPPTVAAGRLFVPGEVTGENGGTFIVALDATTGEEVWGRTDESEWLGREIATAGGRLYCRERLDTLVSRDVATGEERWRFTDADAVSLGRPVVTKDALYVGIAHRDGQAGVVALDPETGSHLGFTGLGRNAGQRARLAASDDRLFVNTARGQVHALESCSVDVGGRCLY